MTPMAVSHNTDTALPGKRIALLLVAMAFLLCGTPAFAQGDAPDAASGVQRSAGGGMEAVLFYCFAAITLGAGLAICLSVNVVRMAVYLFAALA